MANPGGPLSLIGLDQKFVANLVTTGVSSGISVGANQLFRGVPNQPLAQAGAALVGNLATNVVNVGINSILGTRVASASGLSLTSGLNVLASTVTPLVTASLAQGINQSINNSLKGAGPIAPILSNIATGLVNQGFNGLTNLITGGVAKGKLPIGPGTGSGSSKFFPGAGDEPDADYAGGKAYTLGSNGADVVFSIRPANSGPQLSSYFASSFDPKLSTKLPTNSFTTEQAYSVPDGALGNYKLNKMSDFSSAFDPKTSGELTKNTSFTYEKAFSTEIGDAPNAGSWTFICAPEEVAWTTSNAVNRVEVFGTNNPPATSGTKGMREFTLSNALVEGFARNKKVEAKVSALEDLLNYRSSLAGGYVNVPVYQVWANQKAYGKSAYFLLKSVQVKEKMRDLSGDATRAYVDVSFLEVPAFQVNSGLDQAPFSQSGANSSLVASGNQARAEALRKAKLDQEKSQAPRAARPKKPRR